VVGTLVFDEQVFPIRSVSITGGRLVFHAVGRARVGFHAGDRDMVDMVVMGVDGVPFITHRGLAPATFRKGDFVSFYVPVEIPGALSIELEELRNVAGASAGAVQGG
jgi:hypothetical protein